MTRAWSVATDGRRTAEWAVILPSPNPWRSVRLWTAVKMCPCVPSELPHGGNLSTGRFPSRGRFCMLNQRAPDPTWRCNDLISAYQPCYLATPRDGGRRRRPVVRGRPGGHAERGTLSEMVELWGEANCSCTGSGDRSAAARVSPPRRCGGRGMCVWDTW